MNIVNLFHQLLVKVVVYPPNKFKTDVMVLQDKSSGILYIRIRVQDEIRMYKFNYKFNTFDFEHITGKMVNPLSYKGLSKYMSVPISTIHELVVKRL